MGPVKMSSLSNSSSSLHSNDGGGNLVRPPTPGWRAVVINNYWERGFIFHSDRVPAGLFNTMCSVLEAYKCRWCWLESVRHIYMWIYLYVCITTKNEEEGMNFWEGVRYRRSRREKRKGRSSIYILVYYNSTI